MSRRTRIKYVFTVTEEEEEEEQRRSQKTIFQGHNFSKSMFFIKKTAIVFTEI